MQAQLMHQAPSRPLQPHRSCPLSLSHSWKPRVGVEASTSRPVSCGAQRDRDAIKSTVIAGLAAVGLLLHGAVAPAYALDQEPNLAAEAVEEEQAIESDKQQMEYLLQQRDIVRRAELRAQQNALKGQVLSLQDVIQKKITEEKANAVAARKAGDMTRAKEIESETAELEDQQAQLLRRAAKIQGNLSRSEMLERARALSARQAVERTAAEADAEINVTVGQWLEAGVAARQ